MFSRYLPQQLLNDLDLICCTLKNTVPLFQEEYLIPFAASGHKFTGGQKHFNRKANILKVFL
jgi:hypothetical protein